MQPFLGVVNDKTLRHALSFGVGYIHDTQPAQERKVVDALFDMGAIQVCCFGGGCC
jgi:pre-mRNA-splicing helicase BRR2